MKLNGVKKDICTYVGLFALLFMVCGCPRSTSGQSKSGSDDVSRYEEKGYKKVLVVHSYYHDYIWVQSITRGIRMVLDCQKVDLQFYYMDTKRNPNHDWRVGQGQKVLSVIGQWDPDVVITVDDNAQEYVGKVLARIGEVPVVFCGVNTDPKRYGYPAANVTGVIEVPHFKESVSFLKKVLQRDRPLRLVVMSDCSETTDFAFESMKAQLDANVEVVGWYNPAVWDEWKQKVQQAQSQADALAIYLYHTVLPSSDSKQSMNPDEVMEWTVKNSHLPVLGLMPFSVEDGSLCGVLESGLSQGQAAGQLAIRILQGDKPGDIEIQTGSSGQPMLNLDIAGKLGIPVSDELIRQTDILIGKKDTQSSI